MISAYDIYKGDPFWLKYWQYCNSGMCATDAYAKADKETKRKG